MAKAIDTQLEERYPKFGQPFVTLYKGFWVTGYKLGGGDYALTCEGNPVLKREEILFWVPLPPVPEQAG